MHGPTWVFLASLTPFSLRAQLAVLDHGRVRRALADLLGAGRAPGLGRALLPSRGASLSLSDNPNPNARNDSCNRMYI
jgi:hypothetical protein